MAELEWKHVLKCRYGALAAMKISAIVNTSATGVGLSIGIYSLFFTIFEPNTTHCQPRKRVIGHWQMGNTHSQLYTDQDHRVSSMECRLYTVSHGKQYPVFVLFLK
ncbi:hypothetical protein R1flu_017443 [Riccia fluitans]|uniref:Uncharacterized protein n=1 Tax=Riccia fluitans TaxID=41844 RepID=A0ABD1ZD97_9MARC